MVNKTYGRIYLITNLINNKQYVGQTVNSIKTRFYKHCWNAKNNKQLSMAITRAIRKYGKENFKIEEIIIAKNQEELNYFEGFYINSLNTLCPKGYNITNIIKGKGKCSKETIEKMKIAQNKPKRIKQQSKIGKKRRGKSTIGSKSKYCGVYIKRNKYTSKITINYKNINLGDYNTETNAAKAYDLAAIQYFGNNCNLNFPELRDDYINNKIIVNKNTKQDNTKSGIEGINFLKKENRFRVRYFDQTLNKERAKFFKTKQDAINFKDSLST